MSKIFVVQPDKMLQRAFTMALFPDCELEVSENLPKAEPTEFAAAIVDLGALREAKALSALDLVAVQGWQLPLVLIDAGEVKFARAQFVQLSKPVTKESLNQALVQVLTKATAEKPHAASAQAGKVPAKSKAKAKKSVAPVQVEPEVRYIDLVDVVEEGFSAAQTTEKS